VRRASAVSKHDYEEVTPLDIALDADPDTSRDRAYDR